MSLADALKGFNPLSAIASGVNMVGDLFGMSGQAHYQRKNMRAAAELQHEENKYWAEYNTPANQMARLKAAGLNPNLVYGNGADAQFSGSVSPSGSMPHMKGGYGTDFMTMQNLSAQNENLRVQNDLLQNQAEKEGEIAESYRLENRKKAASIPEYQGWLENKLKWDTHLDSVSNREKNHAQALLFDAQRELNSINYRIESEFGIGIKERILESHELENEILRLQKENTPAKLAADLRLTRRQADEVTAQIANLGVLSKLYQKQTENEGRKYSHPLYDKQVTEQHIKNQILNLDKKLKEFGVDINTSDMAKFFEKYVGIPASNFGKIFGVSVSGKFNP